MVSRYNLEHIDIISRRSRNDYKASNDRFPGKQQPRDRTVHGSKLRGDLASALKGFDESRPIDARIEPVKGAFLEVELKRGAVADKLERKQSGVKPRFCRKVSSSGRRYRGMIGAACNV